MVVIKVDSLKEGVNEIECPISGSSLSINELQKDVAAQLILIKKGKKVEIRGKINFSLSLVCARCLSEFTQPFIEEFDSLFLPGRAVAVNELSYEDVRANFYIGEEIDILPIVRDTILLSIPIKPLCHENCKGLCTRCGKNLNEGPCKCR